MKATLDSIKAQSEKLHNRWNREFAGKPRHTRNLPDLEKILEKSATLVKKAKGIPGEKGDALEKVVTERWQLYRTERDAIAEAQFERPEIAEIHGLGQAIDRALAVWRRHYAGRDRRTRDLPRLEELIAILSTAIPRLEALQDHPEVNKDSLVSLRGQLEVLKDERAEIEKLRKNADAGTRATILVAEAQSALDQFRVHFARQSRACCSPERLKRLIATLERAAAELPGLAPTSPSDDSPPAGSPPGTLSPAAQHQKNLEVLGAHLGTWRQELPQIELARATIPPRDLTNQLGGIANQLFQTYQREFAGKPRGTRNLQLLSEINDRLAELLEMMLAHDAATAEPINRKNVPVVDERLRRYEAEWVEIAKVKSEAAAQQAAKGPAATAQLPGITIAPKKAP